MKHSCVLCGFLVEHENRVYPVTHLEPEKVHTTCDAVATWDFDYFFGSAEAPRLTDAYGVSRQPVDKGDEGAYWEEFPHADEFLEEAY